MLRYDNLALRQWLDIMGLDSDVVADVRRRAMSRGFSLFDACSLLGVPEARMLLACLADLRRASVGSQDFLGSLAGFAHLACDETTLTAFGGMCDDWGNQAADVGDAIKAIYEKYALLDPETEIPEDEDKVLVTTMHSAKGLEADHVFISWLSDRFMPSPHRDQEEERRVLYVALTRARESLVLTFPERHDGRRRLRIEAMSPFLRSVQSYLEVARFAKADLR
jgi:hypothetical protein